MEYWVAAQLSVGAIFYLTTAISKITVTFMSAVIVLNVGKAHNVISRSFPSGFNGKRRRGTEEVTRMYVGEMWSASASGCEMIR